MKIKHKKGFAAIGIKVQAPWTELHNEVPKAWQQLKERFQDISGRKSDVMMDVSLEVSNDLYTQLVGMEVRPDAEVPDGMTKVIIPSQDYIYYRHQGDLKEIAKSFGKIYKWAEQQDIEAGDFKLDIGYRKDGSEKGHDLFVKVL